MPNKKTQQALPHWVLPLVLGGGLLLLAALGWVFLMGGNAHKAAEASERPDIFAQTGDTSKR